LARLPLRDQRPRSQIAFMPAIIQQLLFSAGPIALAIMGAYVSISPPSQKQRLGWIVGFIIVGGVSALSIFLEVRGTDIAVG
jgi:hypothetical protein